jgi:Maltokinase N-terminal cap domain
MAILYRAALTPTKIELLSGWVPSRPWSAGTDGPFSVVGMYRFDDPGGEVGLETLLLKTAGGQVLQVPVTYRDAPLDGAEDALICTSEHSVLGRRWVYDASADPVYVQALATAIFTGGSQAELQVVTGDGYERREPETIVRGSGTPGRDVPGVDHARPVDSATETVIDAGPFEVAVLRHVAPSQPPVAVAGGDVLTGTWPGQVTPVLLASARPRS